MSISLLIIVATVAFSYWCWQNPTSFSRYAFYPYKVWYKKEWVRFFSSSLMHVSGMHLFFNMFTFFFFGPAVERKLDLVYPGSGAMLLFLLYISAMVLSEIGTLLKYKNDPGYSSVGASGAVSAVLFSAIWFAPTTQILVMFIPMPGFAFGALYLLYTAYAAKNDYSGQINHDAHLYGSLWGVLFTIFLVPESVSYFFEQLIRFQLF